MTSPTTEAAATKVILDFTNVKESSGINPVHREAGDYRVTISKVTAKDSKSGNPQWVFLFVPSDMRSASYPYYCQLEEKFLWKIRNLLIACGKSVPKKKINVDPNKLVGMEIGVTLEDDEYDGKMKSVISAVFPASDLDDDDLGGAAPAADDDEIEEVDVEEEEPAPKPAARKAKAKPAPEPEEEEVTEEDLDELDVEDI